MESNKDFWNKTWSKKYERYNRHHQAIWDYLKIQKYFSGKIVDLGCGPCVMYKEKDVQLTGIDWSEEALIQAKINCPNGNYICTDVLNTGLPSGQFDAVIACGLLDYFDDWKPVIIEAQRLLKPGCKFYATLLQGFNGHDWRNYPHIVGNWHLAVFSKEE